MTQKTNQWCCWAHLFIKNVEKLHENVCDRGRFSIHCVKIVRIRSYLVHILPHLDWISKDTPYLSIFTPNEGNYGTEKLRIRTIFTQWYLQAGGGNSMIFEKRFHESLLLYDFIDIEKKVFCWKIWMKVYATRNTLT